MGNEPTNPRRATNRYADDLEGQRELARRFALVTGPTLGEVNAYLPANYGANHVGTFDRRILISGRDNAGWTLDGYVIPRLASGLIFAREIDAAERDAILEAAQAEDEMTAAELRGINAPDF